MVEAVGGWPLPGGVSHEQVCGLGCVARPRVQLAAEHGVQFDRSNTSVAVHSVFRKGPLHASMSCGGLLPPAPPADVTTASTRSVKPRSASDCGWCSGAHVQQWFAPRRLTRHWAACRHYVLHPSRRLARPLPSRCTQRHAPVLAHTLTQSCLCIPIPALLQSPAPARHALNGAALRARVNCSKAVRLHCRLPPPTQHHGPPHTLFSIPRPPIPSAPPRTHPLHIYNGCLGTVRSIAIHPCRPLPLPS